MDARSTRLIRAALAVVAAIAVALAVPAVAAAAHHGIGLQVLRLVDGSRHIHPRHGRSGPRTLVTYVRYPAAAASGVDVRGAAPLAGRYPLVVFGHGYATTPAAYDRLLRAWAAAGYVVAAPVFPLGNANAPGGPDRSDLVNQAGDMRFVISRMLHGRFRGVLSERVAVAGHSDGAITALATGFDAHERDLRVDAVIALAGAQTPPFSSFGSPRRHGPPLLAAQGTGDTVNPPGATYSYFRRAPRPKFLLKLLGAEHLPPFTDSEPQLSIVRRVTTAFLDSYLKRSGAAGRRLLRVGRVPHLAQLIAEP